MASKSNEFLLEQRAYIKIRPLLGETPRNIHQDLVQVYGGESCSESTAMKWSLRFREGRVSVEDDPRMGQPIIATTANNIALVAEMCDSDTHITIEQLATSLTLSTGSVHAILTKHLGLEELEHPPYSPDLAPCDFWLFDGLKMHLAGTVFGEQMQIGRAIQRYLGDIPQEEYEKTFLKWMERLKLVVEHKGDFEHL
ncbi:hypothetical protein LOD99_9879 [Oopsacas minuta]|uniref:Mos1 transposase HTH domain-containing protein n=1 Tax=Oopsacas minuta TaxID=111878 RepID=A0AAV7KR77_9METZ|nr:hypothetical protein LOD99_9879 [Oopsacas minuta]